MEATCDSGTSMAAVSGDLTEAGAADGAAEPSAAAGEDEEQPIADGEMGTNQFVRQMNVVGLGALMTMPVCHQWCRAALPAAGSAPPVNKSELTRGHTQSLCSFYNTVALRCVARSINFVTLRFLEIVKTPSSAPTTLISG